MIIETKKLLQLKPAPYNARKSNERQEANLKASLEKFGVVEPIIFNKQTGFIVGGHFRVRELKKLGLKEVDCVIVDLNEADEKELNIRLNANTGEWDFEMLAEWDREQLEDWGLDIPNWSKGHDINNTLTDVDVDLDEEFNPVGNSDGKQRVVFLFDGPDEAESYLNSIKAEFVKRNMAWQVDLSTQSI